MSAKPSAAEGPIEPAGWKRPKGYSNGILTGRGRLLFVAGQIGWDASETIVSVEFLPQFAKALDNVLAVVEAAGGEAKDIARLTIYVTDKREYKRNAKEVGAAYRQRLGKHFPAMSLVEVADLLEEGARVEIEATCVIPEVRT